MNTTENNKKIAEFLHGKDAAHPNQYHENWNELMQIVERIEGLGIYGITIYRKSVNINGLPLEISNTRAESKIKAVYKAVVTFIDWYNENAAKRN